MKIEVKSLEAKSMFKTTLYFACIPCGIMFVIGIISLVIGIATGSSSVLVGFIPFVIMPFIMIIVYGLLSMLVSVVYNYFAGKFGGLELTIETDSAASADRNESFGSGVTVPYEQER